VYYILLRRCLLLWRHCSLLFIIARFLYVFTHSVCVCVPESLLRNVLHARGWKIVSNDSHFAVTGENWNALDVPPTNRQSGLDVVKHFSADIKNGSESLSFSPWNMISHAIFRIQKEESEIIIKYTTPSHFLSLSFNYVSMWVMRVLFGI
jgi:hypothetical protein